jgi:hypothetical protein
MASTFSLSGLLRLVPRWVDDLTATAVTDTATIVQTVALSNGAAAGQADGYWRDLLSIPADDAATIDLFALPLSAFGGSGSLALYKVKMVLVVNRSAAAAVTFGAANSNRWAGFSDGPISIPAGGTLFAFDPATGYAVGSSSRAIVIENQSATAAASVDVYIVGVID